MAYEIGIIIALVAFLLQFFDASLGMGFGEITALLILLGFAPLEIIPAVILASAILSLLAGYLHHDFKNINFSHKRPSRITLLLILFGSFGIVLGSLIAVRLPEVFLKIYIGLLVISIGLGILVLPKRQLGFSWPRLLTLGSVAAFNKGMSGGGYGPVLAGAQILSGVKSKKAVAITALSEGVVSLVGIGMYFLLTRSGLNLTILLPLLVGGILATPFAVYYVKMVHTDHLRKVVGVASIILGSSLLVTIIL